jgi:hypothetical protein
MFFFLNLFKKFARPARERTRDLLISFILSFRHFTAEPQRIPPGRTQVPNNAASLKMKK